MSMENGPLTGIRILELAHWWAAPHASGILGHLGAEVIHVESISHPDAMRYMNQTNAGPLPEGALRWERAAAFNEVDLGKRGITLDLTAPEGLELCKRLIAESDVVTEAYRPAVLGNLGLEYESLKKIKEDIILVSFPALGTHGQWSQYSGYGMSVIQLSGQHAINGYPGDIRSPGTPNIDAPVGVFGALAILMALAHRDASGEGQWVDMAQTEAAGSMFGPYVINASVNPEEEREWRRWGDRHPVYAPQGVYPCEGEDNWIAISIRDDEDWRRFGKAIGDPSWGREARFSTLSMRRAHHDELDVLISRHTATRDRFDLMEELQSARIPAAAALRPSEVMGGERSPFNGQGFIWELDHPVVGTKRYAGSPLRFSATPGRIRRAAPTLGEHNREVLMGELGLSEDEVKELEEKKIIGNTPTFEIAMAAGLTPASGERKTEAGEDS